MGAGRETTCRTQRAQRLRRERRRIHSLHAVLLRPLRNLCDLCVRKSVFFRISARRKKAAPAGGFVRGSGTRYSTYTLAALISGLHLLISDCTNFLCSAGSTRLSFTTTAPSASSR